MTKKNISPIGLPVISRDEAIKLGLKRYFLGPDNPCKRGHVAQRMVTSLSCLMCQAQSAAAQREKKPEIIRQRVRVSAEKAKRKRFGLARVLSESERIEKNIRQKKYRENNMEIVLRRGRENYHANKDKIKSWAWNYRRENIAEYLVSGAKTRAKRKGIPFDLAPSDIEVPDVCPVLGIPLKVGNGKHCWNSPTIDRFVPERGYVRGNIFIISHRANSLKSDATLDEVQKVLNWMKSKANPT